MPIKEQAAMPDDGIVWLFESRLRIKQVVERVGSSYGTIRRVLHESGVVVREGAIGKRAMRDG